MNSEYITCGDEEHFGPACPILQDPSGAVPDLAVDFSTYSGGFCVVSDYSGFFGSLKTNLELTTGTTLLPKSWQIGNYAQAWNSANFARFTWNSVFISIFTTLGTLLIGTMAAYAVARVDFYGKRIYVVIQSCTLFISIGAVVLRPQFDLMVALNLQKSLWGVIIILISAHATAFLC